jgi:hypothetical protein
MIHPLRQSLIVLIALLQLVAPLVHAHSSGMQTVALGVHLPGLEFIAANNNMPSAHAEASRSDCCGILIGVSCGVQSAKSSIDMPAALHSHHEAIIFAADFIVATINFSPQHPPVFSTQTVLHPISPRAPPFLPLSV